MTVYEMIEALSKKDPYAVIYTVCSTDGREYATTGIQKSNETAHGLVIK